MEEDREEDPEKLGSTMLGRTRDSLTLQTKLHGTVRDRGVPSPV